MLDRVQEGCPLSPYIFIMYTEILTTAVRKDFQIKGISVEITECKLSQFADDTTFILGFCRHRFRALFIC